MELDGVRNGEFCRGAGCKVSKQRPTEVTFEQIPVVIWRERVPDRTSQCKGPECDWSTVRGKLGNGVRGIKFT